MKKILMIILAFICVILLADEPKKETEAQRILKKLDKSMFPETFESEMEMTTYRTGKNPKKIIYHIYSKGTDKALMEITFPKRDKGKKILLNKDNLWLYIPTVSRPIRLTRKQSFMGSVFSNEDMMNSTMADDYDAVIESRENGKIVLILNAKKKKIAYTKIKMEIKTLKTGEIIPLSAVYYGFSGKEIKKMYFEDVKKIAGLFRPTVMKMEDILEKDAYTQVTILSLKKNSTIPDYYFDINRMGK